MIPALPPIDGGRFDYVDALGEHLFGDRRIDPKGIVIGGRWWHPHTADPRKPT